MPDEEPSADRDRALLLQFLQRTHAPCPVCKYDLHALTKPACPECGNELKLQVGAVRQPIAWLLIVIAPMIMMIGFALFFGLVAVHMAIAVPNWSPAWELWLTIISGIVEIPLVVLVVWKRGTLYAMSPSRRISVALAMWGLNAALVLVTYDFG